MASIAELALEFGAWPENSARSVLVTILGDSIAPLGGEVWLGDLIALMEPFGYSERLVRTSVFRLAAEGWVEAERVGRRSRYRLTELARREFADAETKIYGSGEVEWDGDWTLVFVQLADAGNGGVEVLEAALRHDGYAILAPGVWGRPGDGRNRVGELATSLGIGHAIPIAVAQFRDHRGSATELRLAQLFDHGAASDRYHAFLERYGSTRSADHRELICAARSAATDPVRPTGEPCFLLRTMLVHDLRRAVLVDPWLPASLLPEAWPRSAAMELAAELYQALSLGAGLWLREVTGAVADPPPRFNGRTA